VVISLELKNNYYILMDTTTCTTTHIIREEERIIMGMLSIRAFVPYSAHEHALRLIYCEILLAGSGTYTREAFQDALGTVGSSIFVSFDDGYIDIGIQALDTTFSKTLHLFEIMMTAPQFAPKELLRIKRFLIDTLTLSKEDARGKAYRLFLHTVCHTHDRRTAYELDTLIHEIKQISMQDLKTFHKTLFSYEWHLTTGGKTDLVHVLEKKIQTLHVKAKKYPVQEYIYTDMRIPQKSTISLFTIPNKQNIEFSIGSTLPITRIHPDFPAYVFGIHVLGLQGGFAGRLMSTVREKEGLTYSIYGKTENITTKETGVWRIMTFFNPNDAVRGLTSTIREIMHIQKQGVTEDELVRFKTILMTRYALIEDSLIKKVGELHSIYKTGMTEDMYTAYIYALRTMTSDTVNDALKQYINPKKIIICGAGPILQVQKDIESLNTILE
jgi:zinc protease